MAPYTEKLSIEITQHFVVPAHFLKEANLGTLSIFDSSNTL